MNLMPLRAALTVAAVYGYFLIFAQFSFIALLRAAGAGVVAEKTALGLMALGGIAGGFFTAWRGPGTGITKSALAAASLTALLTPFVHHLGFILPLAIVTGAAVGIATVSVAALLPAWCGVAWVGLGTGIGYAVCNLPAVFTATPRQQAWVGASFAIAGIILVPSRRLKKSKEASGTGFHPWAAIMVLTSLVWLDSAAFFIIQHEPSLKQNTWGDAMLWRVAAIHLGMALVAGLWLRRKDAMWVMVTSWIILAAAAYAVNSEDTRVLAGWWYPAGVSLYATTMVAWPGWFSGAKNPKVAAWMAACMFSIAGWLGSAGGIGMAEHLNRIPVSFITTSGILTAIVLIVRASGGWRALVTIGAVAATAALFSSGENFAPSTVPDAARGLAVYVSEGCIHCHSQYVRPGTVDTELWGPDTGVPSSISEKPVLIGNRRQGPDLRNIGARRSATWLKEHFINPRLLSSDTTMPSYQYLFEDRRGDDLVAWLKTLGSDQINSLAEKRNSWQPAKAKLTDDGARLFSRHCGMCHGAEGRGDGTLAKRLARSPANLVKGPFLWTTGNPDETYLKIARTIKFGIPGTDMPGHEVFTDSQVRTLTAEVLRLRE